MIGELIEAVVEHVPRGVRVALAVLASVLVLLAVPAWFIGHLRGKKVEQTRSLVERWASELDGYTDAAGRYERWPEATLPEVDQWGQAIEVRYSGGGLAETIEVRSAGRD